MERPWRPRPGDRVVRHPRAAEIAPVVLKEAPRRIPSRVRASPLLLIYGFAGLITLGTFLLLMPFANNDGMFTPFMDAFFTATSAVTVTGLVVQDTATYWSRPGQVVILSLMFIGGLGFMTSATFLLIIIGQRITLANRLLMREGLGVNQLGGLVRLTRNIVLVAVGIQLLGFLALFLRLSSVFPTLEAVWQSAFHAVSGFNNAGFVVLPKSNSLDFFRSDTAILGIMAALIILGSVSYSVLLDVFKYRRFSRFTLDTKLVLTVTTTLWILGAIVIFLVEYSNPLTFGPMSIGTKVLNSLFHSISGRTAGFTTVNFASMEQHANFFLTGLMFIGGASASTAGGIKVNTFAVILVAVLSTLRGRTHVSAFGREIPQVQVYRALVIAAVAIAFVFLIAFVLTFLEPFPFIDLLFEGVSAAGTVGLTTGLTPDLSRWGQLILIFAMFVGRVGPLSMGLTMAQGEKPDVYRFAQERVKIG